MKKNKLKQNELLSLDSKTFQSFLIRIVGLPIFFIVLMLIGFYIQGEYFNDLSSQARKLEMAKVEILKFDKGISEIENALNGYILSGSLDFKKRLDVGMSKIEPISDKLFERVAGDIRKIKALRELLKLYGVFTTHVDESLNLFEKGAQEEAKKFLLNSKNTYMTLKNETSTFYNKLNNDVNKVVQKQKNMAELSAILEIMITLTLVFFIVFIMMKQLKSLTSSYRNLLYKNVENMEELRASAKTKDLFLANMSHEIRTPLGAILGFSELLAEDPNLSTEAKSHSVFIRRNSEHLLGLIDDLFDISRLVADKLDLHMESVGLAQFIDDIENYFNSKLNDRKIELRVILDTRIPSKVYSDPVRLRQIVTNLVGNAIKFSSDGSTVKLIFSFSSGRLQVDVIDSGIGIEKSIQDKIFDAFIQAEDEHSRNYGGAGLGLSISKKLAQAMGGNLSLVSSQIKVGSHFRLSLPTEAQSTDFLERKYREQADVIEINEKSQKRQSFDFSTKKILLAEDSPENQVLFKIFLESANANLKIVGNGSDAVRQALAEDYDAILMDIQMPGLDGYEAVNILRGSHYDKPIIALTAHAMKGEKEKCLNAGFSDYISKPVGQQALLEILHKNTH